MNYAEICIIKRDGKREDFSISKIKNAISKAFNATGIQDEQQLVADITMNVISQFATPTITVEEIQDLVEKALMKVRPEVAKKYIIYREWRNTERDKKTQMKHVMDGIVAIDKNDVNLSNANMSSWATSTSTTWITIRQRRRPASSMTWTTSLNADSVPRTEVSAHRRAFRATPRWQPSFSKPTRTSNTEDRQSPPSISSWRKE